VASHEPAEFQPKPILRRLLEHGVDFVLIGGLAGMARGSSYPSYDVDIAYARSETNLERLASALNDLDATPRGAPPDLPFQLDARTLKAGAHFTFETRYGSLRRLAEPLERGSRLRAARAWHEGSPPPRRRVPQRP
jgi:hypothetical protein